MKITNARLIICSPDRNFVTLRIETDEGIHGLGDSLLPAISASTWSPASSGAILSLSRTCGNISIVEPIGAVDR